MIDPDKKISILDNYLHSTKFECEHLEGSAIEYIPQYYCVNISYDDNLVRLASSSSRLQCHGVALHNSSPNQLIKYIRFGIIHFDESVFTDSPMSPLFMGRSGEITTAVPSRDVMQKIGFVVSQNSAFIDIKDATTIQPPYTIIAPSVTPTVTPTVTPSVTATVTPSVTPTVTPSVTATVTPTVTPSVTATVTPTPSTILPGLIQQNGSYVLQQNSIRILLW
jgi:hypothetical protein